MLFVQEHVRSIDGQLDQLLVSKLHDDSQDVAPDSLDGSVDGHSATGGRTHHLQTLIKSLPTVRTISRGSKNRESIVHTLRQLRELVLTASEPSGHDRDLEWFLLAKITNHVYGHALHAVINQTLPLNDDLWYYQEILSSNRYTALYSVQTYPLRFWSWSTDVYEEVRSRGINLSDGWQQFYGHVQSVVKQRSLADVQRRAAAPLVMVRDEIRKKVTALDRAKQVNASAVGYLLSNGFNDDRLKIDNILQSKTFTTVQSNGWRKTVMRTISTMNSVFNVVCDPFLETGDFESTITSRTREDPLDELSRQPSEDLRVASTSEVIDQLSQILTEGLPSFDRISQETLQQHAKPSRMIRYWLPAAALFISSSTILRIIVNRKAEVLQWIRDFGSTVIDFWNNWVIEPTKKVIRTIRHDEGSEVSIMSKRSLEGDRDSLERMVVDFAVDNPDGGSLSEVEVADIRTKVHEGDLTPVLKAYERELKSPLYGSVRGNLIRTLLIQVQKTKVDVEVAMGGIDSLLKSQELVFGFVGLTPGILVCLGVSRWISSLSATRQHAQRGEKQSQSYQVLRNIDRILTASPQSDAGMLSFEEYGLLVCEAIVLRDLAVKTFSKRALRSFIHDFNDLIDNYSGVGRQIRVADRIRWAYARWL